MTEAQQASFSRYDLTRFWLRTCYHLEDNKNVIQFAHSGYLQEKRALLDVPCVFRFFPTVSSTDFGIVVLGL